MSIRTLVNRKKTRSFTAAVLAGMPLHQPCVSSRLHRSRNLSQIVILCCDVGFCMKFVRIELYPYGPRLELRGKLRSLSAIWPRRPQAHRKRGGCAGFSRPSKPLATSSTESGTPPSRILLQELCGYRTQQERQSQQKNRIL